MTIPAAKILCVRHHPADDVEIARPVLARQGLEIEYLDAWREPIPDSLGAFPALMVMGGTMNVDEVDRYPFLEDEKRLLHDALLSGMDILGVCLGAQLLAQVSGGSVARAEEPACGFLPLRTAAGLTEDPVLSNYQTGDRVLRWHAYATEPPGDSTVLLWGNDRSIQGFRLGERAWGVQFHPEINHDMLQTWIDLAGPELEREWNTTGEEMMRQSDQWLAAEERKALAMFENFARTVAGRTGDQVRS